MDSTEPNADHQPYLRKVAASSIFNSLTSAGATVLLLPLVIRQIGMDNYGLWAVLGIFIGATSILDFGMWKALVYLGARRQHSMPELLSSATIMCMAVGVVFSVAMFVFLAFDWPLFGHLLEAQPGLKWWLAGCGCVIVFASLLTNLARGLLEVAYRGHWTNVGYGVLTLCSYAVAAAISAWSNDVRMLMLGSAAVYVVVLAGHLLCLQVVSALKWQRPSRTTMRAIMSYGTGTSLADLPSIVLSPLLLYLFVLFAPTAGDYGIFDLALKIAILAGTALGMLSTPFFAIVAAAGSNETAQIRLLLVRQLRITVLLGVLGWSVFLWFGLDALVYVFPDRPAAIHHAALIMLVGSIAVAALEPITRMLMGLGRLNQLAVVRLAMLVSALLVLTLLRGQQTLNQFATAHTLGCLVAAGGLVWLNHLERWGQSHVRGVATTP